MLKFKRTASGYTAQLDNGNFVNIEPHCEEPRWIGCVYTADYEELEHTYVTAKTKRELVADFNHEYA